MLGIKNIPLFSLFCVCVGTNSNGQILITPISTTRRSDRSRRKLSFFHFTHWIVITSGVFPFHCFDRGMKAYVIDHLKPVAVGEDEVGKFCVADAYIILLVCPLLFDSLGPILSIQQTIAIQCRPRPTWSSKNWCGTSFCGLEKTAASTSNVWLFSFPCHPFTSLPYPHTFPFLLLLLFFFTIQLAVPSWPSTSGTTLVPITWSFAR